LAYGWRLEAEYESGFVLAEDERDHSPYDPARNVFHAIVNRRATEHGHGGLVRFSLIGPDRRYDIDWRTVPDGAEPVYFRRMSRVFNVEGGWLPPRCDSHHFGWQGIEAGVPVAEIQEIQGGG
jgi:hypothetical protein